MLLREKDRQALIAIFSSVDIPIEVWAYGSRVNGTAHSGSDLDLVFRTADLQPLPFAVYSNLVERIYDSTIPIVVELRDWSRLPASFHQNITARHEILFPPQQS